MTSFRDFVREHSRAGITEGALQLYDFDRQQIQGEIHPPTWDLETARAAEEWLRKKFPNANTLQRKITSLNWLLRWKGVDYQARRPRAEPNLNPRVVKPEEYRPRVAAMQDPMERLAVRLTHDTLWNSSDIVTTRRADIVVGQDVVRIVKARQKTHVLAAPVLEQETAAELLAYLKDNPDLDYLFPGERSPHRNRTWVNAVMHRNGFPFSPRAFRSSGASLWDGDALKELMTQGGWASLDTIMRHYRANDLGRQTRAFEKAMGAPAKDHESDPDVPGYG